MTILRRRHYGIASKDATTGVIKWGPLSNAGTGVGLIRANMIAKFAPGQSFMKSWHRYFGGSWFAAPAPKDISVDMLWNPADPYSAGRKLRSFMVPGVNPAGWVNCDEWNIPAWIIDTSKPAGAWGTKDANGNDCGGYRMGKMWHEVPKNGDGTDNMSWFNNRPSGADYQDGTDNIAIPVDPNFGPAFTHNSTDLSCSVIDLNPADPHIIEYWVMHKVKAGDTRYSSRINPATGKRDILIPEGEWAYYTYGRTHNFLDKIGTHDEGSDTASGTWGSMLQLGIDEMLLWCGKVRNGDGTYKSVPKDYTACQRVLGFEAPTYAVDGGFFSPANFTDSNLPQTSGTAYGQRLILNKEVADRIIADPTKSDLLKGMCWTMSRYGLMMTDRSGNGAFRTEKWYPMSATDTHPIYYAFADLGGYRYWDSAANGGKGGWATDFGRFMSDIPWESIYSLKGKFPVYPLGRPVDGGGTPKVGDWVAKQASFSVTKPPTKTGIVPRHCRASQVFDPKSFWFNGSVQSAPVASDSAAAMANLATAVGAGNGLGFQTWQYTPPIVVATPSDPLVTITRSVSPDYTKFSDHVQNVRIPAGTVPASGSDAEITIVQLDDNGIPVQVTDLWNAARIDDTHWTASWAGQIKDPRKSNGVHALGFGAMASGLAFLPSMVTVDEIDAGLVDHAIGICLPVSVMNNKVSLPANRTDGTATGSGTFSEGQRLRLKAGVNVEAQVWSRTTKIIARAAQKYGFVVVDQGSYSIRAENTKDWSTDPWQSLNAARGLSWDANSAGDPADPLKQLPMNLLEAVAPDWMP